MELKKATHNDKIEMFAPVMKNCKGKYIALLSDDSLDRDGERVGKSALDKIKLDKGYIAGLMDHENKVLGMVAEWINKEVKQIDGHTALIAEPKFFESNPNAKIIKGMLDEGAKIGISIGAIVKEYEDLDYKGKSVRTFTELELLEASFVAVPANKHGRVMAVAKSYNKQKEANMAEDNYTQKDIDTAVEKKETEYTEKMTDLNKQLKSKDEEISKLTKDLEEAEKDAEKKSEEEKEKVEESEKKLKEVKDEIEKVKKESLEKIKFADAAGFGKNSEEEDEEVDKAIKDGKLPIMKNM